MTDRKKKESGLYVCTVHVKSPAVLFFYAQEETLPALRQFTPRILSYYIVFILEAIIVVVGLSM